MSQQRFVGIDIGAETVKLVELRDEGAGLVWARRELIEHHKQPAVVIPEVLLRWDFDAVDGVAACGRLSRSFRVLRVPEQHARAKGFGFLRDERPATLVSMGCNGFSVLELRDGGQRVYRQNARCSQGTGNFLRQLVERFGLDIDEASRLCEDVVDPAPLSGRCPVILKTDLTHLANLGQEHARLVAGLFDAVAENVQVLLQPRSSPERVVLLGGVARSARIREHFRRFLERHQMNLEAFEPEEAIFCDAIGAAVVAAGEDAPPPALDALYLPLE